MMDGNKRAFIADVFGIKESEVPEASDRREAFAACIARIKRHKEKCDYNEPEMESILWAAERLEKAERQLCAARECIGGVGMERLRAEPTLFDGGFNAGVYACREKLNKTLSSSSPCICDENCDEPCQAHPSPCPHEAIVARIEVEGMAKELDAACRKWSKGARGMNAFEAEARALCAYLKEEKS